MGQTDLASNSLTSHPDVFADIVNAIIYKGDTVLAPEHLKPFYVNSTIAKNGKLKGLYRDNCMEDIRDGVRYVIWGLENQYVPDRTTPFKVMGYNYTAYDRQIVFVAKFLCAGYNKKELSKELRTSSQILTHTKDTLYTLASITGDQRYLTARKKYKEGSAVCEVAETLFQMGVAESKKELEQNKKKLEQKETALAHAQSMISEKNSTIAKKDSEIERLRAEIEKLKQAQAGQ